MFRHVGGVLENVVGEDHDAESALVALGHLKSAFQNQAGTWTGQQALGLKLVDQIADFQAVVDDTAKSVGIKGEPVLARPARDKRSLLDLLFGDASDLLPDPGKLLETHVGFYYLWK